MEVVTAELSSYENWVSDYLDSNGINIYGVEGYNTVEDDVKILLDRRKVKSVEGYRIGRVWSDFDSSEKGEGIQAKSRLAELCECDYYLTLFDGELVRVFKIRNEEIEEVLDGPVDYETYGKWMIEYTVLESKGGFVHNLPDFDAKLREIGYPWPANLDGFWYDGEDVRALIEYQTTTKAMVEDHSNNKYFSQDRGRWRSLDHLREGVGKPLLIVVWSPNPHDNDVKLKLVGGIEFHGKSQGLSYKDTRVVERDGIIPAMKDLV